MSTFDRDQQSTISKHNIMDHPDTAQASSLTTKDLPDTPKTSISAVMGPCPALEQESASRVAAQELHAQAQAKIAERSQPKGTEKQSKKSENPDSPFRKALRNLNPKKKNKAKAVFRQPRIDHSLKYSDADEQAYNDCRGFYVKRSSASPLVSSTPMPQYPAPPSTQNFAFTPYSVNQNAVWINPRAHGFVSPYQNLSFFPEPSPQPLYYHQAQPQDFSIKIGGQIPDQDTDRLPSTYLTPTNTNTYAVAGRSHLESGNHTASHHAAIHNASSQSAVQSTTANPLSIFDGTPVVQLATNNIQDTADTTEDNEDHQTFIPGVPYSLEHLDAHLKHPSRRSLIKDQDLDEKKEIRRSASVPADMMFRESAVPAPLNIQKTYMERFELPRVKEDAPVPSPADKIDGKITDKFVVAAFDGVHRHIDDVKKELASRMTRVEEKMDRVVALLSSAAAAAEAAQKKKKHQQQQQQQQQQREIRPNLTGVPPHIPFGGMEGWYNAVKK